jgi:peptidoglycan hydrolase-like protein with peptidoglycan-binding domain
VKFFIYFLNFFLIALCLNTRALSLDFETAKKNLDNKEYSQAYDNFNKCTSDCLETGNCSSEHFMCMLEIGRMLEQGLAENDLSKEQRLNKAKFWYKYCSDKGSQICAKKISTLEPENAIFVKNVQQILWDLGYPIERDDIPGIETFTAIKQFQEKEELPVKLPTKPDEWLKLYDDLKDALANKKNNKDAPIGKPSDYATGIWIGKNNNLYVLTAAHFANGCKQIRSNKLSLRIFKIDDYNDLALLETDNVTNDSNSPAVFPSKGIFKNEKIYVFGYPRQTINKGNSETTEGEIISLKTATRDRSKIIISGDLHAHSSGSPVINEKGLIVGSVHAKSSIWKQIKERLNLGVTSAGQNLATSIYTIRSFLDEHNINYLTINEIEKKDREKIISEAKKYTVPLECWGKD